MSHINFLDEVFSHPRGPGSDDGIEYIRLTVAENSTGLHETHPGCLRSTTTSVGERTVNPTATWYSHHALFISQRVATRQTDDKLKSAAASWLLWAGFHPRPIVSALDTAAGGGGLNEMDLY